MRPSYSELFFTHGGRVSDKWEQYLSIYDRELARFRVAEAPVRLLEIGVQNGGSLEIWEKLLPPGSTIVGMDIDPGCARLTFDSPQIRIAIADASDPAALDAALGDARFDIIIDDGSHRSDHVIATFRACFPRLAEGGLYIVEDLHTSYWPEFGGGFRAPQASVEWLKALADAIHADYLRPEGGPAPVEAAFLREMNRHIRRVTFHDSVAVVEKLRVTKGRPYRRVLTGQDADMVDATLLATLEGPGLGDNLMLTPQALASISATQARARVEADHARAAAERQRDVALHERDAALRERDAALRAHEEALAEATRWREATLQSGDEMLRARGAALLAQAAAERDAAAARQAMAEAQAAASAARAEAEEERRLRAAAEETMAQVTSSTAWRATRPLRGFLSRHPGLARAGRRSLQLAWWTASGRIFRKDNPPPDARG